MGEISHFHMNLLKKKKKQKGYIQSTYYICGYVDAHYALALFCSPKKWQGNSKVVIRQQP